MISVDLCKQSEYLEKEAMLDGLVSTWEDNMRVFGISHIHTDILQRRRNLMGLVSIFFFFSQVLVFFRGSSKGLHLLYLIFFFFLMVCLLITELDGCLFTMVYRSLFSS